MKVAKLIALAGLLAMTGSLADQRRWLETLLVRKTIHL